MNSIQDKNIQKLAERIRKSDQFAFKEFYFLLKTEIFRFFYRNILNYDTSEDLAQETFIKFWEARDRLDPSKNAKSYLFKISKNLLINYFERTKSFTSLDNLSDIDIHPMDTSRQEDLIWEDVKKGVMKLPYRCRTTFILKRYHNLKNNEIAEIMDVSEKTVKNQITKAVKLLREYLNS